jgi:DnaK suppressor protein
MDKKKLEHFRKKLLQLRTQILNRSHMKSQEHLRLSPEDLADESDHAAAVIQQSLALNVQERDRWMLKEIDHALSKFEDGQYGVCEDTEEPIDEARLEAEPFTRYSVEAAELREKKAKRYANFGT